MNGLAMEQVRLIDKQTWKEVANTLSQVKVETRQVNNVPSIRNSAIPADITDHVPNSQVLERVFVRRLRNDLRNLVPRYAGEQAFTRQLHAVFAY